MQKATEKIGKIGTSLTDSKPVSPETDNQPEQYRPLANRDHTLKVYANSRTRTFLMTLKTVSWSCDSSQLSSPYPQFSMESTELFYEKSPHNFTFDVQRSHRVLTILQIIGPGSEVTPPLYPKEKLS